MKQPLAYIHPAAKIPASVVIDPFVTIDANVEIGEGTRILSGVTILDGARIGSNCTIFPGAVIGAVPQDLKFQGEETLAIIGNNTTIREIQDIYRYIYMSSLNVSDAIERIEAELPATKERDEITQFIRNAKRGIIRGYFS